MTNPIRTSIGGALVVAALLPGAALAGPGNHGGSRGDGHDASARTEKRVERVELSLEKAIDAIDDGDETRAIAKLGSVDRHLGRAVKAAKRQVDGEKGPGSLGLAAAAADDVAITTADALDGASQTLTDALEGSLDNSLDARDEILLAIGGAEDVSEYEWELEDISESSTEEAEAFDEGVQDDELTASGRTALTDASAQATATAGAADAAVALIAGSDEESDDDADEEDEDCPEGGPQGPQGPQGGPTGPRGPRS